MELDSSSKSGASSMVPLGIGLLGLVIGAIALFMSFSNSSAITTLKTLNDTVTATASKADAAKATADSLAAKVDADASAITGLRGSVQDFIDKAGAIISQQSKDIETLKTQTVSHSAGTRSGGTADTSTAVAGQGGIHVVQSGDTLSSIAKKYGVSLADVEAANPGVDSAHLKIGQHITIPAAHSSSSSRTRGSAGTGSAPAPTPPTSSGPAPAVAP